MAHFPLLQNIYGIFPDFLVLMIIAQRDIIDTVWSVESKIFFTNLKYYKIVSFIPIIVLYQL